MKKRLLAALLCLCLMLTTLPYAAMAEEETPLTTGTVYGINDGSKLYVRAEPSTASGVEVLDKLFNGDVVTILGSTDANGRRWYQVVTAKDITGWASAQYIRLNAAYEDEEAFENHLTEQGFPDSYKVALRTLHAQYPNWVFQAQHLSVTFAEAVTAQSAVLKNALNVKSHPEAWLSMEYGAYNWTTGEYVEADSGGWVTPTADAVAYFMDPRNFLEFNYIFQFEDLLYVDTHTVEGVQSILPTKYDGYAADLLKAAKEAGVSAYFLATRMAQEGTKVDGTFPGYEGYYNFFNMGAYAHSGNEANTNGAILAQNRGWDTPYKCILGSAEELGKNYIHKKQNTIYYQKFNVAGDNLYKHQYMSNIHAPVSESTIRAKRATTAELAGGMTFVIPVYKEMSETAAPKPTETGNNNNFLDSLTVEGFALSPAFDRYTMEYAVAVTADVTAVTVAATLNNPDATVTGLGTIALQTGENLLPVTVTATSGATRTYTLSVFCEAVVPDPPVDPPTPPETPAPTITGTVYRIGDTVTGVEPSTAIADFITALAVADGTAKVFAADGTTEKAEGILTTGDILTVYDNDGAACITLPVLIYGDVNGDGKISTIDLRIIQKHILETAPIEGMALTAADVNGDGKASTIDLRMIRKYILELIETLQTAKGGAAQ